ncbi:hypothetical protein ACO0LD_23440 [Undibacterium sp. Ji83W]|uniref:hypothetical protein n=1 Tax=Undibacterium sp. Ji83W TaxID=3413043 RepID=UPI003BF1D16B
MSILQTPRIHFKGQISWDPIVTNNYANFYNEDNAQTALTPTETMQQFRESAIESVKSPGGGNWNPHGTHRVQFFNTSVSSVDLGKGPVTTDKLCGAPAKLSAMLVDLEPYGACTSQLFFDGISFGIDGGCRIAAPCKQRFTARYINFQRNAEGIIAGVASVNWQTSFPKQGLHIDAHKSAALAALQLALQDSDAQGLVVSFNAYCTVYFDDPGLATADDAATDAQFQLLRDKLIKGGFQPNPARSQVVGTIGVWRKDEPMHEPGDRALLPVNGAKTFVAAAQARQGKGIMSVDLSNSVSETGMDLKKEDLGTLQLFLTGKKDAIASINYDKYDRAAYEAGAGIVTFDISKTNPADIEKGQLELHSSKYGLLLQESVLRLIPQTPNMYLDQGPAGNVKFQLYARGKPLHQVSDVTLFQLYVRARGAPVKKDPAPKNLKTDAQGVLNVSADASVGNVYAYVPVPGKNAPALTQGLDTQTNTYAYVRVLPADTAIAAMAPSWANVYKYVLINWNAMAPCMDNWLDLANPAQVHQYANILRRLTAPAAFETYLFMPVTRDMTAGQRSLLYKFLDKPLTALTAAEQADLAEKAPAMAFKAVQKPEAADTEEVVLPHFTQLSRSLRSLDNE